MDERIFKLSDGHNLFFRVWNTENPVATVHIHHGMAEHSRRYDRLALFLNSLGYVVYCQDHRGHGFTKEEDERGWFSEEDGWNLVCEDSWELDKLISNEYPLLPHILFGHSMGSFMVATNIARHSSSYSCAIISGTGANPGIVGKIGQKIALFHAKRWGSKMPDQDMDRLIFGAYNKKFSSEGKFAWLSTDRAEVQKYLDDPLCGFVCSSKFYADMIEGTFIATDKRNIEKIRKNLPILFLSGADDPVGGRKGVGKVYQQYRKAGIEDVRIRIFDGYRHEILNDKCRPEVEKAIADFCQEIINR